MGCSTEVICVTCQKRWYCGYGSYLYYEERIKRAPLGEHEGHEIVMHFDEFTEVNAAGDLLLEDYFGDSEEKRLLVKGYRDFEKINLTLSS